MTDFFISYTHKDRQWAEWIAFVLEEAGFTTKIQAWDFRPGSNFVLEMQDAADKAERTVLVLSPDYLGSKMAASEWAAAFAKDPQGQDRRIVPVMVRECQPTGLLPTIVQIRIHDLHEDAARRTLLDGIDHKRAKPEKRPVFPGATVTHGEKTFPGEASPATPRPSASVLPRLKTKPTELEIRKFAKEGFAHIREGFKARLEQASQEEARIETDFTDNTATDFRAELFVDGKSKCDCRIYLGDMFGPNSICYTQGRSTANSANEILSPSAGEELVFSAMMGMGISDFERKNDIKRMSAEQATEYYWSMFIRPLSYR
ncbi:toll/interleukin-1 receptor domain-containing protein [Devosia rhizoryzae]|uniref:Toll/interleukin-1 receptor domain-containing protein n=1 Tax=Devosia rhizoryzae TaxID=2774137 RepID=A0ABX7C752_9HYPH|nr:toll/interleukin-1 receptor domain-containing protein [Devosia rhizoryzae]QQR39024.1 toll/interleukin-1 receptor domain-containing protein [Devosia rhizoryzae]